MDERVVDGGDGSGLERIVGRTGSPAHATHDPRAHGGRVRLVDVKDGQVYLAFGGGCHGCGLVDVTLKQGIERRIREAVPEVVGVVDTTDHSAGENPYYL